MANKKLFPSGRIESLGDTSAVDGVFDCSDYLLNDPRNVNHVRTSANAQPSVKVPEPSPPDGMVTPSETPTKFAGALRDRGICD